MRGESALKRDRRTAISNGECRGRDRRAPRRRPLDARHRQRRPSRSTGPKCPALDGSAPAVRRGPPRRRPRRAEGAAEGLRARPARRGVGGRRVADGLPVRARASRSPTRSTTGTSPALKPQFVSLDLTEDRFLSQIAPARTFCLEAEAKMLQEVGFGLGANDAQHARDRRQRRHRQRLPARGRARAAQGARPHRRPRDALGRPEGPHRRDAHRAQDQRRARQPARRAAQAPRDPGHAADRHRPWTSRRS